MEYSNTKKSSDVKDSYRLSLRKQKIQDVLREKKNQFNNNLLHGNKLVDALAKLDQQFRVQLDTYFDPSSISIDDALKYISKENDLSTRKIGYFKLRNYVDTVSPSIQNKYILSELLSVFDNINESPEILYETTYILCLLINQKNDDCSFLISKENMLLTRLIFYISNYYSLNALRLNMYILLLKLFELNGEFALEASGNIEFIKFLCNNLNGNLCEFSQEKILEIIKYTIKGISKEVINVHLLPLFPVFSEIIDNDNSNSRINIIGIFHELSINIRIMIEENLNTQFRLLDVNDVETDKDISVFNNYNKSLKSGLNLDFDQFMILYSLFKSNLVSKIVYHLSNNTSVYDILRSIHAFNILTDFYLFDSNIKINLCIKMDNFLDFLYLNKSNFEIKEFAYMIEKTVSLLTSIITISEMANKDHDQKAINDFIVGKSKILSSLCKFFIEIENSSLKISITSFINLFLQNTFLYTLDIINFGYIEVFYKELENLSLSEERLMLVTNCFYFYIFLFNYFSKAKANYFILHLLKMNVNIELFQKWKETLESYDEFKEVAAGITKLINNIKN